MTTFLNALDRNKLVDALTTLGMPQEMAEKFASWPDDADRLDLQLTALVNQCADHRDTVDGGDKSRTKFLVADMIILISYMARVEQRGWNTAQLPMMNEAMKRHNQRWGSQLQ